MSGQRKQGGWRCQYCGHVLTTRRELYKHYPSCEEKAKLPVNCKGYTWQPKQIEYVQRLNKTRYDQGMRRTISSKTKKKLSDARKLYLQTHKVKYHWNGPLNGLSYAEQYFYDIVQSRCKVIHWANNLQVSRYRLDFANVDTKVYFEVDGEQHYDEYGILHDIERTKKLAEKGWCLIARVRWRSFMQLNDIQKASYVDDLINAFISPDSNIIPPLPSPVEKETLKRRRKMTKESVCRQTPEERNRLLKNAEEQGLLRVNGWLNGTGVSVNEWNRRKELILSSGVDLMKFGWVGKVEQVTHLTKRVIEATINRFADDFSGKHFRRKSRQIDVKHK